MTDDLADRLDRLEARLAEQQATIEEQRARIDAQAATIEEQQATIEELRRRSDPESAGGDDRDGPVGADGGPPDSRRSLAASRRTALQAGGLLAVLGLGAGVAGADPQGRVGTAGDPLQAVVARQLTIAQSPYDGTNDQTLTDLTGGELALSEGTLGIATDAVGTGVLAPDAVTTETIATDAVTADAIDLAAIAGRGIVVGDAALSVQTTPLETQLTASDAQDGDEFGRAVEVSADGTTAVVGVPFKNGSGANRGKAYVYDLHASSTPATETTQLVASDAQDNDRFGEAVTVSGDGTTAVVGVPAEDSSGSDSGKAYVYDLPASSTPATETSQLVASDAQDGDRFGTAVAVAADDTTAVVGAPREDDPGVASGTAYVYDLTASPPAETSQLTAGDAQDGDLFGQGVGVGGDGSRVLVGAPRGDEGSTDTGAAYSYLPVAIGSF